eukprot:scaffold70045_cov18-Prasinocladus_malaysianus.AAC.1
MNVQTVAHILSNIANWAESVLMKLAGAVAMLYGAALVCDALQILSIFEWYVEDSQGCTEFPEVRQCVL